MISIKQLFVELKQATEGRVVAFSHDITPDMLRTKPDPDVEQRQNQFEQRAAQVRILLTEIITLNLIISLLLKVPPETAQKQINAMNKVVNHVLEQITHSREDWENEATVRANAAHTCIIADTHALIAAVGLGKNLKTLPTAAPVQPGELVMLASKIQKFQHIVFNIKGQDAHSLDRLQGKQQVLSRQPSKRPAKRTHTTDNRTRPNTHLFHIEIRIPNTPPL